MKMLLLDRSNKVLGIVSLSKRGTTGTIIDIKLIMQYTLIANAHGIILAHNCPSGNLNQSETDRKITGSQGGLKRHVKHMRSICCII